MSDFMTAIIVISMIGLLIISIYRFIKFKNARSFVIQVVLLGLASYLLYALFYTPNAPTPKGEEDNNIYLIVWLFIFMLLGMLGNYLYGYFSKPQKERKKIKFDFGLFIAPVFVSPIIFIPLLVAFQEGNISLQGSMTAKIMFFLVAFQNGFLWKEYFDHLRQKTAGQG